MFTFYFMLIALYQWVNYPGTLLDHVQSLGHKEFWEKASLFPTINFCLKSSNIPERYKIYRHTQFINFSLLILQESLEYNFLSTSSSWSLKMSLLVSFKDKPRVQDYINFSTKWSFIILNLVCSQTHRKLELCCNRFVFPKIKNNYCPLSVNMGLNLSLLHPAPAMCLLFLGERCYMLTGLY